jgi:hypothetical protein
MTNTENEMPHTGKQQIADENDKAPNLFQVMASVLAAFFGVQSSKNKERDFKHGNHKVFIIVGILMTLAFLLTVVIIVQVVLS